MHNAIFQDWEAAFGDEDDEDEQECNTHPEKTSQPEATVTEEDDQETVSATVNDVRMLLLLTTCSSVDPYLGF